MEEMTERINTLRYSDIFWAMYSDGGMSCTHRTIPMYCYMSIPVKW